MLFEEFFEGRQGETPRKIEESQVGETVKGFTRSLSEAQISQRATRSRPP